MKMCRECFLVLPLDLFLGHNSICNLCCVSPRNRKPDPPGREWREWNTVSRVNEMFMRSPKQRPR